MTESNGKELRSTMSLRMVLSKMLDGPVYGLRLAKDLGMETATAYGILARLEHRNLASSALEELTREEKSAMGRPARKMYELTELGEVRAREMLADKPLPLG